MHYSPSTEKENHKLIHQHYPALLDLRGPHTMIIQATSLLNIVFPFFFFFNTLTLESQSFNYEYISSH